jgi:hypothetical protein
LFDRERRLQKHEAVKSSGGDGVTMLNGRWVESHDIFEKTPASHISGKLDEKSSGAALEPVHQPAIVASAPTAAFKEEDQQNLQKTKNMWKEIRFREVLLSQTDLELSLIQV